MGLYFYRSSLRDGRGGEGGEERGDMGGPFQSLAFQLFSFQFNEPPPPPLGEIAPYFGKCNTLITVNSLTSIPTLSTCATLPMFDLWLYALCQEAFPG